MPKFLRYLEFSHNFEFSRKVIIFDYFGVFVYIHILKRNTHNLVNTNTSSFTYCKTHSTL